MTTRPAAGSSAAGLAASAALVITWSSGFVGAELGSRAGAAPVTLLGWRFSLLALVLVVVAIVRGAALSHSWRAWARQGLLALLCQVGYLFFVFEGVSRGVHGGTSALIAALQPMLVATVAGRLLGEPSSPMMWMGLVTGIAGVAVVVSDDLTFGAAPAWAYLLPAAGMLSLSAGTVLTRRLRPTEDLVQTITMQAILTAVVMMCAAAATGHVTPPRSSGFWLAVVWLIVLASLGGYVMYVFVTRTRGATVVSTLLYLTPPTTMLWVFLMFDQPVTLAGLIGLAVSAVGVLLVLRGRHAQLARLHAALPQEVLAQDSRSIDRARRRLD